MLEPTQGNPEGVNLSSAPTSSESEPTAAPEPATTAAPEPSSNSESEPLSLGAASPDSALPNDGGDWFAKLPEELHASVGKFSSQEELARSYQNLQSMAGTSIRIPGEDASDKDRETFISKLSKAAPELMIKPDMKGENVHEVMRSLGMPETADDYKTPKLDGVVIPGEEQLASFRQVAHKSGLTNAQFQALVGNLSEIDTKNDTEAHNAFAVSVADLRNEWGNSYGDRYRAAAEIAKKTGAPPEVQDMFTQGTIHTDTIRWMYDLHKAFGSEGSELTLQPAGERINEGPVEAKAKLAEIMNNKQHAYWKSGHPDNSEAIKRVVELQRQANPGMAKDNRRSSTAQSINLQ
jgi:hypothetical protein